MAERRMFAKTIIDSDAFLEMPMSARLLYYDLGMRADDDGFVNSPKKIMKIIGASNDDMNILIIRKFIIPFESGIVVIKHWKIHNYIRNDRYKPTPYIKEKQMLETKPNEGYSLISKDGIPNGYQMDTQDRIGKVSIGENSIGEDSITSECQPQLPIPSKKEQFEKYEEEFNKLWQHYPNKKGKDQAKTKYISARKDGTTYEEIEKGLKNYLIYIKQEKVDMKYIKHGSTWFNQKCWNDDYAIDSKNNKKVDNQMEILKGIHNGNIKIS